ncbi:hypothetical protein JKP88DRAFT_230321 [Tribonema minus]|uniref:NADH dehydrogenase [ubiquinone] 1 beta subcomplex subunit 10 n=1 Tax=Tribonema minus TaxID=303371 RepID=A0A836CMX3_9STRA|nr:hypothetical protein JKP88DRAFT_230321 [Tribonema minus]
MERTCDIKLQPYPHTDDRSDPVAYSNSQEQAVRESFVAKARVKIARQKVSDCYHKEGVNHYQNCREVVEHYLDLIWRKEHYGALKPPSSSDE